MKDLQTMRETDLIFLRAKTGDSSLKQAITDELRRRNSNEDNDNFKTRAGALLVCGFEAQGNKNNQ